MRKMLILAGLALTAAPAHATVLFEIAPSLATGATYRSSDGGAGQGLSFSANTNIGSFAIYGRMVNGGSLKFMVWDATNTTMLASKVVNIAPWSNDSWLSSGDMPFSAIAGQSYYFAAIADNLLTWSVRYSQQSLTMGGITALTSGNANYLNFATPSFMFGGGAQMLVQINGGAVPEPSTWAMMIVGVGATGGALRRRRKLAID